MALPQPAQYGEPRLFIPPDSPTGMDVPDGAWLHIAGEVFGTGWRVDVVCAVPARDQRAWLAGLRRRCEAVMETIDAQMSPWRDASVLSRFNRAPAGTRIAVPEPMRTLLSNALTVAELTGGAFDPALHEAVSRWGFSARAVPDGLPDAQGMDHLARTRCGWRDLDVAGGTITAQAGLTLDLCAIAKGYAVDAVMAEVQGTAGALSALVEIGGELKGWGIRPDGMPWWVALDAPVATSRPPTMAALHGWAVATSGDYRRTFTHGGIDYCHAIDPLTLSPVRTGVASATVFDRDCWRADALATAMMVMGRDAALHLADDHSLPCLLLCREAGGLFEYPSRAMAAWQDET